MAKQEKPPGFRAQQWKPGQSGNPKGRPKRPSFEALVNSILDEEMPGKSTHTNREEIARIFVKLMKLGDDKIIRDYLAREWPATTKVEATVTQDVAFMSPAEYKDPAEWEDKPETKH